MDLLLEGDDVALDRKVVVAFVVEVRENGVLKSELCG